MGTKLPNFQSSICSASAPPIHSTNSVGVGVGVNVGVGVSVGVGVGVDVGVDLWVVKWKQ